MKRVKQILVSAIMITMFFGNVYCVQAKEFTREPASSVQNNSEINLASISKIFNFERSRTTYHVGTQRVFDSSSLVLHMPKNNNMDLVQGKIYFIPMSGGVSINVNYANYSTDTLDVNLSNVPTGTYMVSIDGTAVGTSGQATVLYTFNE